LDAETLKALKNCSIDDEIAKANFNASEKKGKNMKKTKKTNNKKGQDFLDFAQEKGIELNIQYEDKEEAKKYQKDNNLYYKDGKFHQKSNEDFVNKFNKEGNENRNYKKNYYNNNKNFNNDGSNNSYNNKFSNKKNFYFQNKSKNNKFDQANSMMYNPMMYGEMMPNMMQGNGYNNHGNFYQPQQEMDPFFIGERSVEEILSYVFSVEFLNKEIYFRKRIAIDGSIDLNHVLNYNK